MIVAVWSACASAQISSNDIANADKGMSWQQGHDAGWYLDQHKRMAATLAALKPGKKGQVDAFVLVAGMDGDPVFGREAAETARVLSRRFNAAGRVVLLATGHPTAADGSPQHISATLAAIAAQMDKAEDVLVVYATAHGAPGIGVVYKDQDKGYGMVSASRLGDMLNQLGIKRRLILISACYSGQFINNMATPESVIATASDDDRTSFGCAPGNDWTFFGDALINNSLRKPVALEPAIDEAFQLIAGWEVKQALTPSKPRVFIGPDAKAWLNILDKQVPAGTTPKVGRPAIEWEKPAIVGR